MNNSITDRLRRNVTHFLIKISHPFFLFFFRIFSSVQDASSQKFTTLTKELYDAGNRHCPIRGLSGALPELHIDGFDDEQVWQQLELHNEAAFRILMKTTAKLLSAKGNKMSFKQVAQSETAAEEEDEPGPDGSEEDKDSVASDLSFQIPADSDDEDEEGDDSEDDFDDLKLDEYRVLEEEDGKKKKATKKGDEGPSYKKTEVDDQFFKLREMEDFLQKEESKKEKGDDDDNDEDDIDLFDGLSSDDEQVSNREKNRQLVTVLWCARRFDCDVCVFFFALSTG